MPNFFHRAAQNGPAEFYRMIAMKDGGIPELSRGLPDRGHTAPPDFDLQVKDTTKHAERRCMI
jgi:hypothetical protein